jgi:hypothetical protein
MYLKKANFDATTIQVIIITILTSIKYVWYPTFFDARITCDVTN